MPTNGYLAGKEASAEQIQEWVEQFHRDGFLFIPSVLPPEWCEELKADLDRALTTERAKIGGGIELCERMFEVSDANLRLFDLEPIVSFAEALIDRQCHVIHNNSFKSVIGGGITGWHQDDPPHYIVTHGEPPTNVRLPVLLFTANYILTDAPDVTYGPMQVVRGSHLIGRRCPLQMEGTEWEDRIVTTSGPAGSVTMFNNQVWHRGAPNVSDRIRYMAQCSYGRRIIGHKYYPFMNYQMPEHVYADADPRLKRLLGFLPHGAYG
ncbi:MAG TPA: phytanoyl-CoA dioxygenase family protein [Armatimonadota bacterium]|nr:phytanoyl-CoA dioxygenase family protein [Armatimonadota bacterium]